MWCLAPQLQSKEAPQNPWSGMAHEFKLPTVWYSRECKQGGEGEDGGYFQASCPCFCINKGKKSGSESTGAFTPQIIKPLCENHTYHDIEYATWALISCKWKTCEMKPRPLIWGIGWHGEHLPWPSWLALSELYFLVIFEAIYSYMYQCKSPNSHITYDTITHEVPGSKCTFSTVVTNQENGIISQVRREKRTTEFCPNSERWASSFYVN